MACIFSREFHVRGGIVENVLLLFSACFFDNLARDTDDN
jgi:hypothetical protein